MQFKESGIPLTNPESKFHTNWNPVSGIRNPGRGIENSRMSLIPLHRTTLFYWQGGGGAGAREKKGWERGISTTTVSGREIRKGKLSFFLLLLIIQSKKRTQQLPFNVLRGLKQNFICDKSQKTKIRTWDIKKTALLPVKLETFPSRLHHRS